MSFDLGPTLAGWMAEAAPATLDGFVAGDRGRTPMSAPAAGTDSVSRQSPRNGMAQAFHHAILPLASLADRRTEVRWGLRDFEIRFGRPAEGLWLPETAVDLPTLRVLADAGVRWTILAPWQAGAANVDTRRPYRVELGGGRSIVVVFYDGPLSAAVSFEPSATSDADRFARERVAPRLSSPLAGRRGAPRGHRDRRRALRPPSAVPRPLPRAAGRAIARRSRPGVRHHQPRGGAVRGAVAPLHDGDHPRADLVELPSRRPALVRGMPRRGGWSMEAAAASRVRTAGRGDRRRDQPPRSTGS